MSECKTRGGAERALELIDKRVRDAIALIPQGSQMTDGAVQDLADIFDDLASELRSWTDVRTNFQEQEGTA